MKYILILLPILLIACSKPSDSIEKEPVPDIPAWVGTYNQSNGDTAFVSVNGTYCKIEWSPKDVGYRLVFDSVRVASDLTFTTNETTRNKLYTPPWFEDVTATGVGNFHTNNVDFEFIIHSSGHINFSGIKTN
jgi:hypothetical protein